MNEESGAIPSKIRQNQTYLLAFDETEGTILWHALCQEINRIDYQIKSYEKMDFPDGTGKSALQWHLGQLLAFRAKMEALK